MNEFNKYLEHYICKDALYFLLLALFVILIVFFILFFYARITYLCAKNNLEINFSDTFLSITNRFYELVFSGTSILFFMASYYLLERFGTIEPYITLWNKHKDFILLLFIVISCVLNTFLDSIFVRLKNIDHNEKASVRLIGMLYMILIFCYIKFIYENNNYDLFITYFLGLMIGRFVYFDASFKDFITNLTGALKNIPIMLITLACTGALSYYGFSTKYLIKHIGVITNIFFIHLFMCVGIFIIFHLGLAKLLVKSSQKEDSFEDYDVDEEDYDEYYD